MTYAAFGEAMQYSEFLSRLKMKADRVKKRGFYDVCAPAHPDIGQ